MGPANNLQLTRAENQIEIVLNAKEDVGIKHLLEHMDTMWLNFCTQLAEVQ